MSLAALLAVGVGDVQRLVAADAVRINQAIDRGAAFLRSKIGDASKTPEGALIALALLKSRTAPDSPEMQAMAAEIRSKIANGTYTPKGYHVYEAGADATVLADLGGEEYLPELQAIANYLISVRFSTGGWDYPENSHHYRKTTGDTSVTQYACLGLWAAARAGVEIPTDVWNGAVNWTLSTQMPDGGFSYCPGTALGAFGGASDLNMTFAGLSVLLIAGRNLHPPQGDFLYNRRGPETGPEVPVVAADPELGVLQRVDIGKVEDPAAPPVAAAPRANPVGLDRIRSGIARGRGWIETRYRPLNDTGSHHPAYYFYTVERVGALANIKTIGNLDWYDASSAAALSTQQPDGSFTGGQHNSSAANTSFVLLFLAKSTAKTIGRTPEPPVGGGLLTGGKGEPTEVVAQKKEPTPLDQLLASLQNPGSLDLGAAQSELVEQIQLGDKSQLVGQKEQLVKLIAHPHGEVRRTAAWALGRTNDLRLARHLVDALEDPDVGVMMEAHAGLSWLSRRFDGFGLPANPLDGLAESASEEERQTAIRGWRVRARREWGQWYLRVRPYSDRGDEFEAQLRQRLADK